MKSEASLPASPLWSAARGSENAVIVASSVTRLLLFHCVVSSARNMESSSTRPLTLRAQHFDETFLEIEIDHFTHGCADRREVLRHLWRPAAHEPLFHTSGIPFTRKNRQRRIRQLGGR